MTDRPEIPSSWLKWLASNGVPGTCQLVTDLESSEGTSAVDLLLANKLIDPAPPLRRRPKGFLALMATYIGAQKRRRAGFRQVQKRCELLFTMGSKTGERMSNAIQMDETIRLFGDSLVAFADDALSCNDARRALEVLDDPRLRESVLEWKEGEQPRNAEQDLAWRAQGVLSGIAIGAVRAALADSRMVTAFASCRPADISVADWRQPVSNLLGARAATLALARIGAPGARETLKNMDS